MRRQRVGVRRRTGTAVAGAALAAAALLAGCSSASDHSSAGLAARAPAAQAPADAAGHQPAAGQPTGGARPNTGPTVSAAARQLAYTAQLELRVADLAKAVRTAEQLTQPDGYVAEEQVQEATPGSAGTARLTLKLPTAGYHQALEQLAGLGQVIGEHRQAEDLTQQLVDLDSRLKSQQASIERVRALMNSASSIADVVSLESELGHREADLESLQHQRQELAGQVALSTVTVSLSTAAALVPPAPHPARTGFWHAVGSALDGGWQVLLTVLRGIVLVLAALAPFVLVLSPLGWAAWLVRRRRTARRAELALLETEEHRAAAEEDGEEREPAEEAGRPAP
ncbi:hypothetical protein CFP65_5396 [Kitasatospora sp. MMS16-BH015]|uniref:DUF4349 domain-containing protein n=1 Tax=Kitasatospora sp. MMS16-BH015 TaxID=2018025 RepID=UPI000CA1B013|nr:DUF4349 domain-containing protein [Kitasatospora sp. MMS16-BH015]AUG80100.1 hypothetical protein CFP65_5396 [Kitasatospora sp. MMS16-BH015]